MTESIKLEVLPENQLKLFNKLAECTWISDFYFAGGTALALLLGHRQSIDFDFFTKIPFKGEIIKKHLAELGEMELFSEDKDTINAGINGIRVSFFIYEISMMNDLLAYKNISIASLLDIALMKLAAISGRGSKKDFIDLYFLLKYFELSELLKKFPMKFGKESTNIYHLLKSLVYFNEAEDQPLPVMLKQI